MTTARPRILIVEDEVITARDLEVTLESLGYEVCGSVRSGEEAVHCACREQPDLVLMDIVLQGEMDGIEASTRIRQEVEAAVVFLTAYGDQDRLQRAKSSRPYGYILKPFDDLTLRATLEMALNLSRTEARLRDSEATLRGILDATFDAILLLARDGTILDCNEATARRFHRKHEDILGECVLDLMEPDAAARRRSQLESVFETGEPIRFEDDREGRIIDQTVYPVRDDRGRVNRVAVFASDITDRRRAETARQQSDALCRAIIEHATDAIFIADPESGILLDLNPRAEELIGCPRGELIGKRQDVLHPPEESEEYRRKFFEAAQRAGRNIFEVDVVRSDGTRIPVEVSSGGTLEVGGQRIHFGIFRDISDRKQAEEELRESEIRFRTVADFTYDWEYWIGAGGSLFYISPSCERITGHATEEFVNDPGLLERLIHPDDLPLVRSTLFENLNSTETLVSEFRVVHRNGAERWIGHISQPVFGEQGEYLGRRASNRDITEQKRAEKLLRESEELHRQTLSSISDAVLVADDRGNIVFASGNLSGVFGLKEREVLELGNTRYLLGTEVFTEETPPEKGRWTDRELQVTAAGDRKQTLQVNMRKVKIHGGSLLVTCKDISERARAQEEEIRLQAVVKNTASEWQATFDSLTMAVVIFDGSAQVRRLNEYARKMLRRPFTDVVGCHAMALSQQTPWPDVARCARSVTVSRQPITRLAHDSTTSWEITALASSMPGGEEAVICMIQDVTEELRLQERLRRSETMSALGSLVAGVAHEVRNPLFAISATLDALEECHGELAELQPFSVGLRTQVERLQTVMSELLELGRPVGDNRRRCSVEQIVGEAVNLIKPLAAQRQVSIEVQLDKPEAELEVHMERIVVACGNLLANACEHSPANATVMVTTRTRDDAVHLVVRDAGPGFRDADISSVFKPFFSRRHGGIGLGLAIVARTVELHGGSVKAYNHDMGGAVVEVRLLRKRTAEGTV